MVAARHMKQSTRPIVLVEDEDDDVQFVRRALGSRKILNPVVVLPDVHTATAYLRRVSAAELPVVVVLDIYLPSGGSGLDLLAWMRSNPKLAAVPVIVLSVSSDRTQETQALAAHATIVLRKATTPELLLDAIAALRLAETPTRVDGKTGIVLEPK